MVYKISEETGLRKEKRRIDLHIHSTASDGTYSPAEILNQAQNLHISAIAITDHDTLQGVREALQSGIPDSVEFISGIEISSIAPPPFQYSDSLHILGYGIRLDDPALNRMLATLQHARIQRNPGIIKRLKRLGFDLSLDEVTETSGVIQIGRPHIAGLMLRKGYVGSIEEAFDRWLGYGKPAFVKKEMIACDRVIDIIRNAGGIAVLAHPGLVDIGSGNELKHLVIMLKEMGLQGLEVYYSEHTMAQRTFFAQLAERYNLLKTGGSDFHGATKKDIRMGSGRGDLFVPYNLYRKLIATMKNEKYK